MTLSSYSNTFTSPPYLDDFHSFIYVKAFYLHSLSLSALLALSKTQCGWTRFLPDVTFALNHYLGHSKLFYFHAVNILIHLLAFFALFWFVGLVLAAEKKTRPSVEIGYELAGLFPLCVAAIWALSPVQTSAVTYLVQRMASMQALFFTLSAACFLKARFLSAEKSRASAVFYFLCLLAALCAGLSKQNAAMLPVILAVIDIWFFDSAWLKKVWAACRKTGWKLRALVAALLLASSYYAFFVELPKILAGYAVRNFTLTERLLTEARVVVWYMTLMLWPVPSRLSMEHDPRISTSLFSPFTTLPAILFIVAIFFLAVRYRKRWPVITFGIVWFFLNLVIESTIIPIELVFEHRLYLPSMGFYLSVAAIFVLLMRKAAKRMPEAEFAKAACSLLLLAAAGLTVLTFLRNGVWKNPVTIRYDTVEKAPDNPRANADYANTLCTVGQYREALKYAEKAIKIGRKGFEADALAQNAIVIALVKLNKPGEAIESTKKLLQDKVREGINVDPLPDVCLNVSQACFIEKKPKEAYTWALRALKYVQMSKDSSLYKRGQVERMLVRIFSRFGVNQIDPSLESALKGTDLRVVRATGTSKTECTFPASPSGGLAKGECGISEPSSGTVGPLQPVLLTAEVFKRHGEQKYARQILEMAYARDPHDPLVTSEIASFRKEDAQNRAQKRNWNAFQKYVRDPFSRFNFDMEVAYLVQMHHLPGFFQSIGANRLDAALKISPGSRNARLLKAWYLYNGNDAAGAVKIARRVLAGDPDNSNVYLALGFFLAKTGDNNGAVAAFKKVIELYPGYPRRAIVEQMCSKLQSKGKLIESASAGK